MAPLLFFGVLSLPRSEPELWISTSGGGGGGLAAFFFSFFGLVELSGKAAVAERDLVLCFALLFLLFLLGSSMTARTGEARTNPSMVEGGHGDGNTDFLPLDEAFFLGSSAFGADVSGAAGESSSTLFLSSSNFNFSGVAGVEG